MLANNIRESSNSTGVGNIVLEGPVDNGLSFSSFYNLNEKLRYAIDDRMGNWEKGIGYLSLANTLVREFVTDSSNNGSPVSFNNPLIVFVDRAAEDYMFPGKTANIGSAANIDIIYPTWFTNYSTAYNRRSNQLWLIPFVNDCPTQFTEWSMCVKTTASEFARMGIYNCDPATSLPTGSPVYESNNIDLSSSGIVTSSFIDNTVNPVTRKRLGNHFWLAMAFSGNTHSITSCSYVSIGKTWTPVNANGAMPSYYQSFIMGTPIAGTPILPAITTINSRAENFPIAGFR